jgi:hypothetical protein
VDARLFIPLLLALLLPALPVNAQGFTAAQIGLGYSPGSLTPVDQGVPIYATGDQVWIVSYGDPLNVQILNASGRPAGSFFLGHMQPTLLLTFSSPDKPGTWLLNISTFSSGSGV